MEQEQKKINEVKLQEDAKILTGQNVENGLNYQDVPVINEQIKPKGTAILG